MRYHFLIYQFGHDKKRGGERKRKIVLDNCREKCFYIFLVQEYTVTTSPYKRFKI